MARKTKKATQTEAPLSRHRFTRLESYAQKLGRIFAYSPLPEILFIAAFIMARWWKNSDFSYPSEMIIPLIALAALASIVWAIYKIIFGNSLATHTAALLLSYCLYNYQWVSNTQIAKKLVQPLPDKWTSELTTSLILSFLLAVLAGLVGWAIVKLVRSSKEIQQLQVHKVLLFVVLFLFVTQAGKSAIRLWDIRHQLAYHYPANLPNRDSSFTTPLKPDIYYLVFDRYASADTLKNIYGYDNSDLLDYLSNQGFVNRPSAYANYPFTMASASSTMAMNYFPEFEKMFNSDSSGNWQTAFPYRSILNDPPIAQVLKANGYKYNQVSSWWDFTRIGIKADANPTESYRLNTLVGKWYLSDLQRDIFNRSVLSPWLKRGLSAGHTPLVKYDLNRNPRQNFEAQIEALKSLSTRGDKNVPQFSFAHFLVPHDPYIFKADGSNPDYDQNRTDNGVDETIKYTNQLSYLNKRLKNLISYIKANSPNAVFVLQADEGPYPKEFRFELKPGQYYDPINLELPKMKQKFGVLASYRMPGFESEAAKEINSSVNAFRFVLNKYLGYSLPMLSDCHLTTGDKFAVYDYRLVSSELSGQPSPEDCDQYQ